jgi:hypothetical protein
MYHNLQLQNTVTFDEQTVIRLSMKSLVGKQNKTVFQIPKQAGLFCPPSFSEKFRGPVSVPSHGGGSSPKSKVVAA